MTATLPPKIVCYRVSIYPGSGYLEEFARKLDTEAQTMEGRVPRIVKEEQTQSPVDDLRYYEAVVAWEETIAPAPNAAGAALGDLLTRTEKLEVRAREIVTSNNVLRANCEYALEYIESLGSAHKNGGVADGLRKVLGKVQK